MYKLDWRPAAVYTRAEVAELVEGSTGVLGAESAPRGLKEQTALLNGGLGEAQVPIEVGDVAWDGGYSPRIAREIMPQSRAYRLRFAFWSDLLISRAAALG